MKRLRNVRLIILLIITIVYISNTAKGQWIQTTPFGHAVGTDKFCNGESVIYGANYDSFYKTTNNGLNWDKINLQLNFSSGYLAKFSAHDSSICAIFIVNQTGGKHLIISQNKGITWAQLNDSFPSYPIFKDIKFFNNKYYLSTSKGLYTSINNGLNWNKNLSLDSGFYSVSVNGNIIFAVTERNYNSNVIKKSYDNGNIWTEVNNSLWVNKKYFSILSVVNKLFVKVACQDSNYSYYYDSIFVSNNDGLSWKTMHNGLPSNIYSQDLDFYLFNDTIYYNSLYKVSIYDTVWVPMQLPYNGTFFAKDSLKFIGTSKGNFLSNNNGNSWNPINNGLDITTGITSLASKGNDIYASTYIDGIYKTSNNGQSWTQLQNVFLNNEHFGCLRFKDTVMYSVVNGNSIKKSVDNGITWHTVYNTINNNYINELKINGNKLIIATTSGIYISDNLDLNWNLIQNGLPDSTFYDLEVDGNKIYAITENCLYSSINGGINWNILNSNCGGRNLSVEANRILVGKNSNFDFNYSEDYGLSWSTIHQPFHVTEILLHSNLMFFAGMQMLSPYTPLFAYSFNKGQTLINENVTFLCDPLFIINDTLFVAGSTIWKRPLSNFVGIKENTQNNQLHLYPNPATNTLTLNLSQQQGQQNASLSIYDIQGKQLLHQNISQTQTQIDISSFAKGIYIVKVQTDKESLQSKFVKE